MPCGKACGISCVSDGEYALIEPCSACTGKSLTPVRWASGNPAKSTEPVDKLINTSMADIVSLRNSAVSWGLLPGHRDYVRFVILGRSRTGSNLLRGLLQSRHDVTVHGEIFKNPEAVEWGTDRFSAARRTLLRYRTDPARFLESDVFRRVPLAIKALGFKLFYYHAQQHPGKLVWDYLRTHREIRVIHIKRHNILRTHLSRIRAEQSNSWVDVEGRARPAQPVELDFADCEQVFVRTRAWEQEYDRFFSDHPLLEVIYEELAADHHREMERIQEFLSLELLEALPQTHKQSSDPLREAIVNYAGLKLGFKDTPWAEFFDE